MLTAICVVALFIGHPLDGPNSAFADGLSQQVVPQVSPDELPAMIPAAQIQFPVGELVPPPPGDVSAAQIRQRQELETISTLLEHGNPDAQTVLIDQGHLNYYTIMLDDTYSYSGFTDAAFDAGYDIRISTVGEITAEALAQGDVYVVPLPQQSFTDDEVNVMQRFVINGGAMLLIADYSGDYSDPARSLANSFGAILNGDIVTDPDPADHSDNRVHWVKYTDKNFAEHPIFDNVNELQSFTSSSILPYSSLSLVKADANAVPTESVVAVATEYGLGRVVILGDSNFFDDTYGLNKADNEQFAVNIINWLTGNPTDQNATPTATTPAPTATDPQSTPNTPTPIPSSTPTPTHTPTHTPSPIPTATPLDNPPDADGDGLLNTTETNGWNNSAGYFITDPTRSDTDNDGLLDGQEKLFNTNPLNQYIPGLHAVYNNAFQTKEYFGWNREGGQYIAYDAAIIRRGSTLTIGGPAGASINISKSIGGLNDLSGVPDAVPGRWNIYVGPNNTVGDYTITLTKDGWSDSMKLYVIFEMPTDLGPAEVGAYLYDDDPANNKDNTSIWFTTSEEAYTSSNGQPRHRALGYGINFTNDQYKSYVFEIAISAVNGQTSKSVAALRIAERLDVLTRFDPTKYTQTMYDVIYAYDQRNQCSNIANAQVSFNRSMGIPSRPMAVDWDGLLVGSGYFDHAAEIWLGGTWKVSRAYNVATAGEDAPLPIAGGIVPVTDMRTWGIYHYPESYSDIIIAAKPNWRFDQLNTFAHRAYIYDNGVPNQVRSMDWLETRLVPYWGWGSEPLRTGGTYDGQIQAARSVQLSAAEVAKRATYATMAAAQSDYAQGDQALVIESNLAVKTPGKYTLQAKLYSEANGRLVTQSKATLSQGAQTISVAFDGSDIYRTRSDGPYTVDLILRNADTGVIVARDAHVTAAYTYRDFQEGEVTFTDQYSATGSDTDGDGRFDSLTLDIGVNVSVPGEYTIMGTLADGNREGLAKDDAFVSSQTYTALQAGAQTVQLDFDGRDIFSNGKDGPYTVGELLITDVELPSLTDILSNTIDSRANVYTTTAYSRADFESPAAYFTGSVDDSSAATNADGLYETLPVNVGLAITEAGTYTVTGDLYDSAGSLIETASWSGDSSGAAQLTFSGQTIFLANYNNDEVDSYTLRNLRITDAAGLVLIAMDDPDFTTSSGKYSWSSFAGPSVTLTGTGNDFGVDTDADNLYDEFVVEIAVSISDAGTYWVEGWLADENYELITWSESSHVTLPAGDHTIELAFDGEAIHARDYNGQFIPTSLKVLGTSAVGYLVLDEIDEATRTTAYDRSSFEIAPGTATFPPGSGRKIYLSVFEK